jgi:hypothetical protein
MPPVTVHPIGAAWRQPIAALRLSRCSITAINPFPRSRWPSNHYENFPVASILLPRSCAARSELIYRFAREADDFADEGDAGPPNASQQLDDSPPNSIASSAAETRAAPGSGNSPR